MSNFERFVFFEVTIGTITKTKIRFENDCAPGIYCPKEKGREERKREGSGDAITPETYASLSFFTPFCTIVAKDALARSRVVCMLRDFLIRQNTRKMKVYLVRHYVFLHVNKSIVTIIKLMRCILGAK